MAHQIDTINRLITIKKNKMDGEEELYKLQKHKNKKLSNVVELLNGIEEQRGKYTKIQKRVAEINDYVEGSMEIIDNINEHVTAIKQNNEDLETKYKKKLEEHNHLLGCVHALTEITNTHINYKELPSRLRGVSVVPEQSVWLPFDFAAENDKPLSELQERLQSRNVHSTKWLELLLGASTIDRGNAIHTQSVIEIDLTSPTAQK
ncbi:kinetochore protein Spc25 isoform X2 [Drosophila busckii]|uniref:kinetochore protein Spc25 isoform X2 n=1 Tax=Drosophila busckii TaxID=30019 RepID=UPI00083F17E2|nr:kinetochore protein Spc25 isoform X2 [Drosophila busckii]